MSTPRNALVLLILLAVLVVGLVAVTAQGQDEDAITTFDVGDPQGIDSMSPLIGITVAAYEAWNLQYPMLTGQAAKDFSTIPALATKWTASEDQRTWTYTLRPGLKWSDGKPLTSEDVAWTINTARKEEWLNHTAVVQNLTAEAPDPRTVVISTSVPDPKLPAINVFILPKHIWGKMSPDERANYDGESGVGGGPFVLERFEDDQFARFRANPHYWRGRPAVDKVVLRKFNNPDAMVAALRTGELDAAFDVSSTAFNQLKQDENVATIEGYNGSMDEIAINGGDGLKKPHPALLDPTVREAIGHAIDRDTLVRQVLEGYGRPQETLSVSPHPKWTPEVPSEQASDFDLERAKQILEDAGYRDSDGDGIREMPGGGRPLNFTYMVRSDSVDSRPIAEFFTGWLDEIGIATTRREADDSRLTTIIGKGEYDMFAWGWTPFVDPDTLLSYFTCGQVASDPENPTDYYNDANYCDPGYDRLYEQQKVELDEQRRVEIVHEMLLRQANWGVYHTLWEYPDLQAYRKDRFTGFVRQPAKTGPVIYAQTSPSYARLEPVTGGDDGGGSGGIIAAIVVAVVLLGAGALVLMRRRTAYERE